MEYDAVKRRRANYIARNTQTGKEGRKAATYSQRRQRKATISMKIELSSELPKATILGEGLVSQVVLFIYCLPIQSRGLSKTSAQCARQSGGFGWALSLKESVGSARGIHPVCLDTIGMEPLSSEK